MLYFNSVNLTELGVLVTEHFPIPVSRLREEEVVVPGRDGIFTFSDNSYEGCEITGRVAIKPTEGHTLDEIIGILQGWGKLTIPGMSDRYYIAKVSNLVSIEQFILNEVYEIPLTFKVQPYSYLMSGATSETAKSGTVVNPGNVIARPVFTVTAPGNISITINNRAFSVQATNGTIIDCELQEAIDMQAKVLLPTSGEFPYLEPGDNTVKIAGSMNVEWKWRCL